MSQANGDDTMGAVLDLLRHLTPRQLGWLKLTAIPAIQRELNGVRPTGTPGDQVVQER